MRVLCTEMGGHRITVQTGCIGDTTAGGSIALNGRTAVIEAGAPADFVGVPGSRGGVEISRGHGLSTCKECDEKGKRVLSNAERNMRWRQGWR